MLKIFASIGVIIVLGVVILGYLLYSGMCENTEIISSSSPNGNWRVVLFERSCGATTGFSTQISLIEANDRLPNSPGNVYRGQGYPEDTVLKWETNKIVKIKGIKNNSSFQLDSLNEIEFDYE